jgi:hypothetical protein
VFEWLRKKVANRLAQRNEWTEIFSKPKDSLGKEEKARNREGKNEEENVRK